MVKLAAAPGQGRAAGGVFGFVGAGAYSGRTLIKAFRDAGAGLKTIVSSGGVSAVHNGRRHGFEAAASDPEAVIADPAIDAVCIATRHDSHADLVRRSLKAGKHVFVEKPLCLTLDGLEAIEADLAAACARGAGPIVMVGFNRRFAPLTVKAKALLEQIAEPKALVMTVNAGAVPGDHWTQDPQVGGGRLVGEACHFIDLLRHLVGAPVRRMDVTGVVRPGGPSCTDVASLTLSFEDGSIGVVNYLANGHRTYPKERLEAFAGGRVLVLDNFRRLTGYGWPGFRRRGGWRQDKGQAACAAAFVEAVRIGGAWPIPWTELAEVSRLSIQAAERAGG